MKKVGQLERKKLATAALLESASESAELPIAHPGSSGNTTSFYRPELDCLRFFAFSLVFLFHGLTDLGGMAGNVSNAAAMGVCLFFLLSAYLICELLEREKNRLGTVDLRAFYIRRVLRVWPLYLAVLLIDFFLQRALHSNVFNGARLAAFFLLAGNLYVAAHGFTMTLSTPLWSVSIEEQFYLIWPTARKWLTRRAMIRLSLLVYPLSFASIAWLGGSAAASRNTIWVNSFAQFQFFATGRLLSLGLRGRIPQYPVLLRGLILMLGVVAMGSAQLFFHLKAGETAMTSVSMAAAYLLANIACLLIFLCFLGERHLGAWRPIIYLGKISYGLYVFHWTAQRIVFRMSPRLGFAALGLGVGRAFELILAFALTTAMAAISYQFFEAPILRYKRRFERVATRPV